jgi:hypothetical protein
VAPYQQGNTHFSRERGMRTMNWEQGFLYIRESYQQLKGLSLLMIGCMERGMRTMNWVSTDHCGFPSGHFHSGFPKMQNAFFFFFSKINFKLSIPFVLVVN